MEQSDLGSSCCNMYSTTTGKQLREQTTFIMDGVKGVKTQRESTYSSVTD